MTATTPNKVKAKKINDLIHIMEEFRKHHPDMQVQTMLSFLYVAYFEETKDGEGDNTNVRDLCDVLDFPTATASRNVSLLAGGSKAYKGLNLLSTREDPNYRTRKIVSLTPQGKTVLKSMLERLGE